jgi:hypothetical protein
MSFRSRRMSKRLEGWAENGVHRCKLYGAKRRSDQDDGPNCSYNISFHIADPTLVD